MQTTVARFSNSQLQFTKQLIDDSFELCQTSHELIDLTHVLIRNLDELRDAAFTSSTRAWKLLGPAKKTS